MKVEWSQTDGVFLTGATVAVLAMALAYLVLSRPWQERFCSPANLGGQRVEVCGKLLPAPPVAPAPQPPAEPEPADE